MKSRLFVFFAMALVAIGSLPKESHLSQPIVEAAESNAPASYYEPIRGEKGYSLKTGLYNIIKNHTVGSYAAAYVWLETLDIKPNGTMWDMYSDVPGGTPAYTYSPSKKCGTYTVEGVCWNREHSMPKSWFDDASPMYSDVFHLYATDGYVNGMRNNYPFGEVGTIEKTSTNGSKLGAGKSSLGYSGKVFEPIDEYKGDFARTYFYMVTRYENIVASFNSEMLNGTSTQAFTPWALNMLMNWHLADPVSDKEINRNNLIYSNYQHNRNPFIDHPEFAEIIFDASYTGTGALNDNGGGSTEVFLTSIAASGAVSQFKIGDDFSANGLIVTAKYSDGTQTILLPSQYTLNSSDFNNQRAGRYTITIGFENKTTTYQVNVKSNISSDGQYECMEINFYKDDSVSWSNTGNNLQTADLTYVRNSAINFDGNEEISSASVTFGSARYTIHGGLGFGTSSNTSANLTLEFTNIEIAKVELVASNYDTGGTAKIAVNGVLNTSNFATWNASNNYQDFTRTLYELPISSNTISIDSSLRRVTVYNIYVYYLTDVPPVVIGISAENYQTEFFVGDDFTTGNLLVYAFYDDGISILLPSDEYTIDYDDYNKEIADDYVILIHYLDFEFGYTVTVENIFAATEYEYNFYDKNYHADTQGTALSNCQYLNNSATSEEGDGVFIGMTRSGTVQYNKHGGITIGATSNGGKLTLNLAISTKYVVIQASCYDDTPPPFTLNGIAPTRGAMTKWTNDTSKVPGSQLQFMFVNSTNTLEFESIGKRATIHSLTIYVAPEASVLYEVEQFSDFLNSLTCADLDSETTLILLQSNYENLSNRAKLELERTPIEVQSKTLISERYAYLIGFCTSRQRQGLGSYDTLFDISDTNGKIAIIITIIAGSLIISFGYLWYMKKKYPQE